MSRSLATPGLRLLYVYLYKENVLHLQEEKILLREHQYIQMPYPF